MKELLLAFTGIILLMGFWILVQRAWLSGVANPDDVDALACHGGCQGCSGRCHQHNTTHSHREV